jgi:hypothetical protein
MKKTRAQRKQELQDKSDAIIGRLLALQNKRQSVRPEEDLDRARRLERQVAEVDAEIERWVYELYGLTEEEIRLVEGRT